MIIFFFLFFCFFIIDYFLNEFLNVKYSSFHLNFSLVLNSFLYWICAIYKFFSHLFIFIFFLIWIICKFLLLLNVTESNIFAQRTYIFDRSSVCFCKHGTSILYYFKISYLTWSSKTTFYIFEIIIFNFSIFYSWIPNTKNSFKLWIIRSRK